MGKNFLAIDSNFNNFSTRQSAVINAAILENNEITLSKIYSFCQKSDDVLFVTGFTGTGKKQIVNHLLHYLDSSVYTLHIDVSESTTLDDILLNLWAQFVSVASNTDITYKTFMSNSFQERIMSCFLSSTKNILIVLYNLEKVSDDNLVDILNFLWSIVSDEKIKLIITAKTFDTACVPKDIQYSKVIMKALNRLIFEKYLQSRGIKSTSRMFDELYKITRGYFLYTEISANILLKKSLSINDYLVAYTNSGMSFDNFLAKAYVSMLPTDCKNVLALLTLTRHPVNNLLLDYIEYYDKQALDVLVEFGIVNFVDETYILNAYFEETILSELTDDELCSIHSLLIKFYNSQLSLKPSERFMLLSRNTMRKEIDYHKSFIYPSKDVCDISENVDIDSFSCAELKIEAENLISLYRYSEALKYYLKMLTFEDCDEYFIYEKLVFLYEKLNNFKNTLNYLSLLEKHYSTENCFDDLYRIRLKIAQSYYQYYHTDKAITLLVNLIEECTNLVVTVQAYTILANLYISKSLKDKAYELYNKAIILAETVGYNVELPELYFKFALLADERQELNIAEEYYKKCIVVSGDSCKYKSLSYSNLGDFYLDSDNKDKAVDCFKQAFKLDESSSNDYGQYYSALNIAKIIVKDFPEDAYSFLKKAKVAAIKALDIFAVANASLLLGDYFISCNNFVEGLKEYYSVLSLVKDKFSNENKAKIISRINDIKIKIGDDKFNEFTRNYEI